MDKKLLFILLTFSFGAMSANQNDLEKLIATKKTQAIHMDLSNADLRQYPFIPGKIDLQGANISHSNLSGVDLSKMNLGGANLSYTDLSNAKLNQVNLSGANLDHANLSGADIQRSDLSNANLNLANLASTNLQQSILTKANLTCANLNQADLTKSTFTEANVSGASFVNTITTDIVGYGSVIDTKVSCE
ncbi:MAG: hypothetical protein ACD_46C00139G0007 [uncultured bacterium]|nr:MAG: hypothetical protein ACD_46C00139G0007 [uncultured bacterium]